MGVRLFPTQEITLSSLCYLLFTRNRLPPIRILQFDPPFPRTEPPFAVSPSGVNPFSPLPAAEVGREKPLFNKLSPVAAQLYRTFAGDITKHISPCGGFRLRTPVISLFFCSRTPTNYAFLVYISKTLVRILTRSPPTHFVIFPVAPVCPQGSSVLYFLPRLRSPR